MHNRLEISGLCFSYRGTARGGGFGIEGIGLTAGMGKVTALLGPSGSGKSTLLKLISGELKATSGRIDLDGVDLSRVPFGGRHTATVQQNAALIPDLTVAENARLAVKLACIPFAEGEARLASLLDTLGVSRLAGRLVRDLSGGEQQRAAIARALVVEPRILMLDEPTTGLDQILTTRLAEEIRRLRDISPAPIILLVSHDRDFCLRIADELVVIDEGRTLWQGAVTDAASTPQTARACEILDLTFLLRGEINDEGLRLPPIRTGLSEVQVPLPSGLLVGSKRGKIAIAAPRSAVSLSMPEATYAVPMTKLRFPAVVVRIGQDGAGRPEADAELANGEVMLGIPLSQGLAKLAHMSKVWVNFAEARAVRA